MSDILKRDVKLQKKISIESFDNVAIDYDIVFKIEGTIGVVDNRKIKPSVITFIDYNYDDMREPFFRVRK